MAKSSNHLGVRVPTHLNYSLLMDKIMTQNKKNAAKAQGAKAAKANDVKLVGSAWEIKLEGINGVRTIKEDKKIDKNILIVSRTPKQTVAAMNGIMDLVVDESGMTLRQRLTEAGIVVGKNGLTLKSLYAGWAWKDEQGQLLKLQTKVAKLPHEDDLDEVVYAFNANTEKWESFKQLAVGRMGVTVDFMGKETLTGWSIAMILDGLRQMQHLDEYKTKQMEYEKAWGDAKKVYTFKKVQNKGGMNNKPMEVNKSHVQFL